MRNILLIAAFCSVTTAAAYMGYRQFFDESSSNSCPSRTATIGVQNKRKVEIECPAAFTTKGANQSLTSHDPASDSGFSPTRREFAPEAAYGPPTEVSSRDREILRRGNPILLQAIKDEFKINHLKDRTEWPSLPSEPASKPAMAYADSDQPPVPWMPRASDETPSKSAIMPRSGDQPIQSSGNPDASRNGRGDTLLNLGLKQILLDEFDDIQTAPAPRQPGANKIRQSSQPDSDAETIKQSKWAFHYFVF